MDVETKLKKLRREAETHHERRRQAIEEAIAEGYSIRKIGAILGITHPAVLKARKPKE